MIMNFMKIKMANHEKLHIPATCESFLCRKKNTVYAVIFIHQKLWTYGENKTEISVEFDQVTYIGKEQTYSVLRKHQNIKASRRKKIKFK